MVNLSNISLKISGVLFVLMAVGITTGHYEPSEPFLIAIFALMGVFLFAIKAEGPHDGV